MEHTYKYKYKYENLKRILVMKILRGGAESMFTLTSNAIDDNGHILEKYTCDGPDITPSLQWASSPEGTKSYVLIMDDPDAPAGTWIHWIVWNIPAHITKLDNDNYKQYKHGYNSWNKKEYGGPCPPANIDPMTHRYYFKLYAIDTKLEEYDYDKPSIIKAMEGHILGQAELMGRYKRKI